jgi:methyl-accepting chemotaxis protein
MATFRRFSIRGRLTGGFLTVIILMLFMVGIARYQFSEITSLTEKVTNVDLVKVRALYVLNSAIRDNALRTLEHFVWTDKEQIARLAARMSANKQAVDDSLTTLDKLVYTPEGKEALAAIRAQRKKYLASFMQVAQMMQEGRAAESAALVTTETLPALDALQDSVSKLNDLQTLLITQSQSGINGNLHVAGIMLLGLGLLATLVAVAAAWVITRSILQELGGEPRDAVHLANQIAAGDLSSRVPVADRDSSSLMYALAQMQHGLQRIVMDVREGTSSIFLASQQIAAGNHDLASRTEEQASSLEETASSMEEIASAVQHGTDNAEQAHTLAAKAVDIAHDGGQVVSQVVVTMDDIQQSSRRIFDIISVIDGIAFQTNILALNAAVEAARAGEQGRGFAVVASEVRMLAQRSATAAREIKQLISDSVQRIDSGAGLVVDAGRSMEEIVSSVNRVATIMEDMNRASHEQNAGISQVNVAITALDQATQQNAALVEQLATTATSMQEQSQTLAAAVAAFRLGDATTWHAVAR